MNMREVELKRKIAIKETKLHDDYRYDIYIDKRFKNAFSLNHKTKSVVVDLNFTYVEILGVEYDNYDSYIKTFEIDPPK